MVAKDAARFQALYGFAPLAVYSGNLSNGGETVTLVNASAAVVDTVTYADAAPWPAAADGTGPSLELRGLLFDNTLAENWGASTVTGGTPGCRQHPRRHRPAAPGHRGAGQPAAASARRAGRRQPPGCRSAPPRPCPTR